MDNQKKSVTVALTPMHRNYLKNKSSEQCLTVSDIMRRILDDYINNDKNNNVN